MEGVSTVTAWIVMIMGFVACHAAVQPSEDYPESVALVPDDVYHLFWRADATSITFEVHAKVKGWVGFGLSPNGGMAKSDVVIGWVKDGVPYFKDRYADKQGIMPRVDVSQDWTLLAAQETSTHTMLKFSRPLYSCDPEDRNVTADTTRVIFSYSDTDPTSEDSVIYHEGNRGTKSLLLIAKQDKVPPPLPADAFYKDYLSTNVTLPDGRDTVYWCQGFNAPNISQKHHLIRIEPIIQPGNEAYVHHIVLYGCYHIPGGLGTVNETQGAACKAHNMPWKECLVYLTAWGVGGTAFNFPEHVGFPFGDSGGIVALKLETHYDNPQLTKGVVDSSGLRLWFTPTLRQYDAANLVVGMIATQTGHILPAGYPALTSHGHCTKECLSKGMGEVPEIHVFSVFLHTHLLGTGVKVHHYRDGVEQPLLGSDLAYDFNYQETRAISPEVTIKKGDNLLTECFYNTKDLKNATFGGFGTPQEMCIAFMFYYPKISLNLCNSNPTQANMAQHLSLKYEGGESTLPAKITAGPYSGKSLNQFVQAIGKFPDQATMDKYQESVLTGEIVQKCQMVSLNTTFLTYQIPRVVSEYRGLEEGGLCSGAVPTRPPPGAIMWTRLCSWGLLILFTALLTTN